MIGRIKQNSSISVKKNAVPYKITKLVKIAYAAVSTTTQIHCKVTEIYSPKCI